MSDVIDSLGSEFEGALDAALAALITEAAGHRESVGVGLSVEDPAGLHSSLLECRRALDRTLGILASLTKARGRIQEVVQVRKEALDHAWDQQATNTRTSFAHGDSAPRERYAKYNLGTIDEQRALRQAERASRDVDTALDIVRIYLRGLEGTRADINGFIYAMKIDARLET